jgi:hypothetical protein
MGISKLIILGRFDNVAVKDFVLGCRILRPSSKPDFISDACDGAMNAPRQATEADS